MIPPVPPGEQRRLEALRETRLLDTPADADFDDLARIAAQLCHTPMAGVALVDRDRVWFKARFGPGSGQSPRESSFCAWTILGTGPLVVPDAGRDERFERCGAAGLRFYAGAPLLTRDGDALGTVCVMDTAPRALGAGEREALAALARQAAALIELRRKGADMARANAALERAVGRASEGEARLRAIFDTAVDGIVTIDEGGIIQTFNPAAERIFGYPAAEVVGRGVSMLMPEPHRSGHDGYLARYLAGGGPRVVGLGRETEAVRRDGTRFPVFLSVSEAIVSGQRLFTGFVRDISESRQIERMKNEFVSIVSHELRTPLTSIRGALGVLETGAAGELPGPGRELVGIARSNTERLIRLVNDILDLEKIEAGRMDLRLQPLSAREVVAATLQGLAPLAETAGVRLEAGAAPGQLVGDRDRLIQVLTNLVSNAIKFSPAGAPVRVDVERRASGHLRFSVVDRGPGIPSESMPKLFGRFQQLDSSDRRHKGGSGLGLSISKAIVEQHRGRIGVDSRVGEGSTFWFELEAQPCGRGLCGCRALAAGPEGRRLVLLVEREPARAASLHDAISAGGFRVEHAPTLEKAEAALGFALPAAIVLGAVDGGAAERVRRVRDAGDVPVISLDGGAGNPGVTSATEASLLPALRRAVRRPGPPRVLVVESDPELRLRLASRLRALGAECVEAADGFSATQRARRAAPDLVVVDDAVAHAEGCQIVDILAEESGRVTPLIVLSDAVPDLAVDSAGRCRCIDRQALSPELFEATARELLAGVT